MDSKSSPTSPAQGPGILNQRLSLARERASLHSNQTNEIVNGKGKSQVKGLQQGFRAQNHDIVFTPYTQEELSRVRPYGSLGNLAWGSPRGSPRGPP